MTIVDSVISMYLLSLGEFQIDGYNEGYNNYSAWLMFFLATWILMLIMLNFIITTMGEPFERVQSQATMYKYKQYIQLIVDNMDYLNFDKKFKGQRYILVVKPEETGINAGDPFEDQMNKLKT